MDNTNVNVNINQLANINAEEQRLQDLNDIQIRRGAVEMPTVRVNAEGNNQITDF